MENLMRKFPYHFEIGVFLYAFQTKKLLFLLLCEHSFFQKYDTDNNENNN